jgi:hypothetical protein
VKSESLSAKREPYKAPSFQLKKKDVTILPTRLNSAESREFKHQLETSLKIKEQKRRVGKDVTAGARLPRKTRHSMAPKSAVVEYKQRIQVTVLSDNASVHSKEMSMDILNNSLGSLSMASVDKQSTPSCLGKLESRDKPTNGQGNKSRTSNSRSPSTKKRPPVERHVETRRRLPTNNQRQSSSSEPGIIVPMKDASSSSQHARMDGSGSSRHRKAFRNATSKTPKSPRNKLHKNLNQEAETAQIECTQSTHARHLTTIGPSTDKNIDASLTNHVGESTQSPQPRRRRRPVEATNLTPRESIGTRQEEKLHITFGSSRHTSRDSFSSKKPTEFKTSKGTDSIKRRRATSTNKKPDSMIQIPENESRIRFRTGQDQQALTERPIAASSSTPRTSASESDPSAPGGTGTMDQQPERTAIEISSQHSLGLPSQHSLGSYLPDVMRNDNGTFMSGGMEHGNQATSSTSRLSGITELVKYINPIKKRSDIEGHVALMDSDDGKIDDFDVTSSTSRIMESVLSQIIKRPLLSHIREGKEEDTLKSVEARDLENLSHQQDESATCESVNSIDIFATVDESVMGCRSSSQDSVPLPLVFKFDASDPTIAQFDPNQGAPLKNDSHDSCTTNDRIYQRQSLQNRRAMATRSTEPPNKDSTRESLHDSCTSAETLQTTHLSAVQKCRTMKEGDAKASQQSKSQRSGKCARDVETSRMKEGPMKDGSSSSTSSRRQRHFHLPSSFKKTPPTPPGNCSHRRSNACSPQSSGRDQASHKRHKRLPL